jgi:multicomponent Na+:H+ antiporter subunit B
MSVESLINIALLLFLGLTAFAILKLRALFAVVMLSSVFSLVSAALLVHLDAVDVAFTEAAVGAGISTVLMLATLALTSRREKPPTRTQALPLIVVFLTGLALVYGTLDMPRFGDPSAPVHGHVAPKYINDTESEIGMPNIVTAVLASYRGFDTLGEVTVIFTAGIGVLLLLAAFIREPDGLRVQTMDHHLVLRVVTKVLIGPILLFALYVQFHGDYGPGGGFQAGVIFAAAFIIYALVFGLENARKAVPGSAVRVLVACGVLLYGGVGVLSFAFCKNYLNYSVLGANPVAGQHLGILLVEFGVGLTVSAVMVSTFYAFAGQNPPISDEDW